MSQKRVDIEITGSAEKFRKAADEVQKKLDKINDSVNDLGENDSVDKFARRFQRIGSHIEEVKKGLDYLDDENIADLTKEAEELTKALKDGSYASEQLSKTMKGLEQINLWKLQDSFKNTLGDMQKISEENRSLVNQFNKLDTSSKDIFGGDLYMDKDVFVALKRQFGEIENIAEDAALDMVDVAVNAENLNRTKFNHILDEIEQLSKLTMEVNKPLEDIKKLMGELDGKDLDDLQKEFKGIEKTSADLCKTIQSISKAAKDMNNLYTKDPFGDNRDSIQGMDKELNNMVAIMAEIRKRTNDTSDRMTKLFNNIIDNARESTKEIKDFNKEVKDVDTSKFGNIEEDLKDVTSEFKTLNEVLNKTDDKLDDVTDSASDLGKEMITVDTSLFKDLTGSVNSLKDVISELVGQYKELNKAQKETKEAEQFIKDVNEALEETEDKVDKLDKYGDIKFFEQMKEHQQEIQKEKDRLSELEQEIKDLNDSYNKGTVSLEDFNDKMRELNIEASSVKAHIEDLESATDSTQESINDFNKDMVDSVEAYEKIREKVIKFIETHKNAEMSNKRVAESFMRLHNSLKEVYADIKPLPDGMFERVIKEAKEVDDAFDLISTEQLMSQLDRVNKMINDTTEKTKEFKKVNKESWGTRNAADDLINSMEDVQSFADKMAASVEKVGDEFVYLGDRVRDANKEFDDKKIDEYMEALRDYVKFVRDSGGQISKAFADESGKLDVEKFFNSYEKFGRPLKQMTAELQKNKAQILESIKAQKEHREELQKAADEARDNAKALEDNAKAQLKNAEAAEKAAKEKESLIREEQKYAQTAEDSARLAKELEDAMKETAKASKDTVDAKERLAKAEKDYADAADKAKNIDKQRIDDAEKLIKKFNEQAEALRKLGANIKDISKKDLSFDSSLGSLLDDRDVFGSDLPNTFADLKEDIKALFKDMDSLDFGSVFDGLKDIGAGLLSKLPTWFKAGTAAVIAFGAALKECAETGINQFKKGMDTVKNVLSSIVGVARDVGSEIRDTFENVTGMDMDLGSLMEVPINFESQMAKAGAIAGATGEKFEELEEAARRLGATTRFSATEVAEAIEYMGMAGWTNDQMLKGIEEGKSALDSVLNLSIVSGMDLGQASDFVTDGLTALGMEAEDAAYMVDILAKASTSTNTSVEQMQRAFTNCAPVAGTLGINLEDLSLALGLMADKGVKGAKAGTALKNLMANLSAPTEKQLSFIKKFNLEAAQKAITEGKLTEGIKLFKEALSDPNLTKAQKNAIITTIAGKEALSGISALLNTTESDLAELEKELGNCSGAAEEMAGIMEDTVKNAMLQLSSAIQERLLQVFDQCKDSIKGVTKQFAEFFNIWNGFSKDNGSGLADAIEYLRKASEGWGKAIAENLEKAIGSINDFISSDTFNKMLEIGTNIINGISNGIKAAAENGTLQNAITTAIYKLADWFSKNLDTVIEVGRIIIDAICQGIEDNSDEIGKIVEQVIDMQNELDKIIAYEKWKFIGENLATFIGKGFTSKITTFFSGIGGFFEGIADWMTPKITDPKTGKESYLHVDPLTGMVTEIPYETSKNKNSKDTKKKDTKKTTVTDEVTKQMKEGKVNTDKAAAEIGQGISDNILKKLETMDAGELSGLRTEMESLQKTIETVASSLGKSFGLIREYARTEIVGMTNIFRNQFVNVTNITRNQMVNVSNIIRNQALNWTNIFKNQMKNSRDEVTRQMLSMASVTRTQMTNISNIIRNQSKSARDNLTSQFISMAKVVSTQMKNCLSSVKSYMSQIKSQTSKTMTLNVNASTPSYTPATVSSASALYAANAVSAFSIGDSGNMSTLSSRASSVSSTMNSSYTSGASSNGLLLEIPLVVDGRELARSSAQYMNGEIKKITKRNDRKRGVK